MAVHGKGTKLLINQYNLSGFLTNVDMPRDADTPQVTTFGNDDRQFITGLRSNTMGLTGIWSGTSNIAVDALSTFLGKTTSLNVTYAPNGLAQGNITYSVQSIKTNYTATSPVDGAAAVTIDLQGNDIVSRGISLHNLTARTSAGNGSAYKLTAGSSAGARAYLHVTAHSLPATTRMAIAVQDSPTCSPGTWADLIAFDTISSDAGLNLYGTHQRKTASGNVDQYVRSEWDNVSTAAATKTWSSTFTIAFEQI